MLLCLFVCKWQANSAVRLVNVSATQWLLETLSLCNQPRPSDSLLSCDTRLVWFAWCGEISRHAKVDKGYFRVFITCAYNFLGYVLCFVWVAILQVTWQRLLAECLPVILVCYKLWLALPSVSIDRLNCGLLTLPCLYWREKDRKTFFWGFFLSYFLLLFPFRAITDQINWL